VHTYGIVSEHRHRHLDRQGVLLDNNELSITPDISIFNGTSLLSFRNNQIAAVGSLANSSPAQWVSSRLVSAVCVKQRATNV
jgi:hypothetical protein